MSNLGARAFIRGTFVRYRAAAFIPVAAGILSVQASVGAEPTTARWVSTTGVNWEDPANWNTNPYFPNNAGTTRYDVAIEGAPAVRLASDVSIDGLLIDQSRLDADPGSGLTVHGATRVRGGSAVAISGRYAADHTILEDGSLTFNDGAEVSVGRLAVSQGYVAFMNGSNHVRDLTLDQAGQRIDAWGELTTAGTSVLTGGQLNAEVLRIEGNFTAKANAEVYGNIIRVAGHVEDHGRIGATTLHILSSGVHEVVTQPTTEVWWPESVINEGILRKSGPGHWTFSATLNNPGRVEIDEGSMSLVQPDHVDGTFHVSAGGKLILSAHGYPPATAFLPTARIEGPGPLALHYGRVIVPGSAWHLEGEAALLPNTTLFLTGESTIRNTHLMGELEGPGTATVPAGGELRIDSGSRIASLHLKNTGTTTVTGTLSVTSDTTIENLSGGTFTLLPLSRTVAGIKNDSPGGTATFLNAGLLEAITGPQDRIRFDSVDVINDGTIRVYDGFLVFNGNFLQNSGALDLHGGNVLVSHRDGVPNGINGGTITGDGAVYEYFGQFETLRATISPGHGPGKLILGRVMPRYKLNILDGSELLIDLAGTTQDTEYDHLFIIGSPILDGELRVSVWDEFASRIAAGDTFEIVSTYAGGDPIAGAFDNAPPGSRALSADGRWSFHVDYGPTSPFDPTSVVLSDFQRVPEPATGALLLATVAGSFRRRSRRK